VNGIEHWLTPCVADGVGRLAKKQIAVDVGANIGTWTAPLSEIFSTVVAVEPDGRASDLITRKDNVQIVHAAVSDKTGSATLFKRTTTGHNSLLEEHPIGGEGGAPVPVSGKETVDTVTLDDLLKSGADFVKIDIEGGEVAALRGCKDKSRWSRTFFVVECHDTFGDVSMELDRLGKTVTHVAHPYVGACHPGHCWAIGE
jgi:FkbM family methyltransferase